MNRCLVDTASQDKYTALGKEVISLLIAFSSLAGSATSGYENSFSLHQVQYVNYFIWLLRHGVAQVVGLYQRRPLQLTYATDGSRTQFVATKGERAITTVLNKDNKLAQ